MSVIIKTTLLSFLVLEQIGLSSATNYYGQMIPEDNLIDDMYEEQTESAILTPQKINEAVESIGEVYGMLFQTDYYMNQAHRDHLTRGALRSGSGTDRQQHDRVRLFEEEELLDQLEESKEIVTDPRL